MIEFYLFRRDGELEMKGKEEECKKYLDLFEALEKTELRRAVFFSDSIAIYFEKNRTSILVGAKKSNVGAAELFAKKILRSVKVDLSSIEEAFEFAEKIDRMSLDELAKHLK